MTSSRQLLSVVDLLYDAVADLDRWPTFLEGATRLFNARGAQIGHFDLVNSKLSFDLIHGYDWSAEHVRRYESLLGEDPRIPYFAAHPFKPVHCRMSLTDDQLHNSRVYKEVLSVGGVEYSLGVNLVEAARSLTFFLVLRDRDQPPFSERECDLMEPLIPHLARALKLQRDLGLIEFGRSIVVDTLDTMALGIVVIDAEARVQFINEAARRIVTSEDGLRLIGDRLIVEGRQSDNIRTKARQLIRAARSGDEAAGAAMMVERPSGGEPYPLIVSALWGNQLRFGWSMLSEPLAIIFLRDPELPDETRAESLQRLYGLTPSQARLADQLATGSTLHEAARHLRLTPASARQYLKVIFQKTGTNRQAQLVRKVLMIPPAPRWRDQPAIKASGSTWAGAATP
jgi:DNA-binding CsgD family transcriptional regulator